MLPTRSPLVRLWLMASRVRSPIASRSHWLTAVMMFNTRRPAAEPVSSDSATDTRATPRPLEALQQRAQILHAPREPIELSDDHRLYIAGINEPEQPRHTRTVQALGGLSAVDDDVDQVGVVDHGHGPNLLGLGFERNAPVRLLVCGNPNIANCFHQ